MPPFQTPQQQQAAFAAAGLTPQQQAGVLAGTGYTPITSNMLQSSPTPSFQSYNPFSYTPTDFSYALTPTPLEREEQSYLNRLRELTGQTIGESAFRREQEEIQGLRGFRQAQRDLEAQLRGLIAEQRAIPSLIQQEFQGRGATRGGVAPIEIGRLRENEIKSLTVQSLLESTRGNIANALELVDEAVSKKFDPIREERDAIIANLELVRNSPEFTLQQKRRADAQLEIDQRKKREETQREKDFQDVRELAVKLTYLNPNIDPLTVRDLQNAKTAFDVIRIAREKGLVVEKQDITATQGSVEEFKLLYGRMPTNTEELNQFTASRKAAERAPSKATGIPLSSNTVLSPQGIPVNKDTGKPMQLAEGDKKLLDAFNKIDNTINQLEGAFNRASSGIGIAPFARLFGSAKKVGQRLGLTGPSVREYEALVNASVGPIARAVLGEVGVLTDKDVERAKSALPSLTDTPEEARRKIRNMRQIVTENRSDFYSRLGVESRGNIVRPEDYRSKYNY
jgi:hypothetical protein